jgi:1-acyl-sn-glycerol-3-phosphate acyltransferase
VPSSTDSPVQVLTQRPVRVQGNAAALGLLKWLGWHIRFDGLPARQGLMVFYPHTSYWDFLWVVLGKWASGVPVNFLVPDALLRKPVLGWLLRRVGGAAVDRSAAASHVAQMVDALRRARAQSEMRWLGMTPEGTRAFTEGWHTGFHHVATQAGVPLALVTIDYKERWIGVVACLRLSGDLAHDLHAIDMQIGHHRGKHPQRAGPVRALARKKPP